MLTRLFALVLTIAIAGSAHAQRYDRDLFITTWPDADGDCLNTRHEMLAAQATRVTSMTGGGCRVDRGRWYDPYSDTWLLDARDLDIDHVIPLKYAWDRGARDWTPEKRRAFAMDARFLLPVRSDLNRAKGARGPVDWLPPNAAYHCEYVLRFRRGVLTYGLVLSTFESAQLIAVQTRACGGRDITLAAN